MIELVIEKLLSLITLIANVKKSSIEEKTKNREMEDEALTAVFNALTETYIYINEWRNNGERSLETEKKLVKLWGAAAIPVRHYDRELSEMCEYKSMYWVNPDTWNPEKAKGLSIDIENVRDRYRDRLNSVAAKK